MNAIRLWQVMTPTKYLGGHKYVNWRIASTHEYGARRMAEQVALQLGVEFQGDIEVDAVGVVYVP